ncbi:hypothetical protein DRJ16_02055, partial [Candidatus Woesearchaeota archaeon]
MPQDEPLEERLKKTESNHKGTQKPKKKKRYKIWTAIAGTAIVAVAGIGLSINSSYYEKKKKAAAQQTRAIAYREPGAKFLASRDFRVNDLRNKIFQNLISHDLYVDEVEETNERNFSPSYSKPKKYSKIKVQIRNDEGHSILSPVVLYIVDSNGDGRIDIELNRIYRIKDADKVFDRIWDEKLSGFVIEEDALELVKSEQTKKLSKNLEEKVSQKEEIKPVEFKDYLSMFNKVKQAIENRDPRKAKSLIEKLLIELRKDKSNKELLEEVMFYASCVIEPAITTLQKEEERLLNYQNQFNAIKQLVSKFKFKDANKQYESLVKKIRNDKFLFADSSKILDELISFRPKIIKPLEKLIEYERRFKRLKSVYPVSCGYVKAPEGIAVGQFKQHYNKCTNLLKKIESEKQFPNLEQTIKRYINLLNKYLIEINRHETYLKKFDDKYKSIEIDFKNKNYISAKFYCEDLLK